MGGKRKLILFKKDTGQRRIILWLSKGQPLPIGDKFYLSGNNVLIKLKKQLKKIQKSKPPYFK